RRALLCVLGICLTFSILGVTAALTGSLFGSALQRPAVLAAIALVLVGLAGSNFGFYQLRVPSPVMQRLGRLGEGGLGAFFMGLTMGVVAAPCIGPAVLVLAFLAPATPPAMRWPRRVGGIALVAFGLVGLLGAETESPVAWVPFTDEALARATAAGRPVLIDFEAAWCLPCREMDRTTFRDPAVVRAAADFVMVKVDVTTEDERSSALTGRFGVAGVPTLVLLGPDGRERGRFA